VKRYRTIVADPPWSYRQTAIKKRTGTVPAGAEAHYGTISMEEIAAIPVAETATDDAYLFMWVTNPKLYGDRRGGLTPADVLEAWGFKYQTTLTWLKEGALGMGFYFRGETEHVLFATRGDAKIPVDRRERNWFKAPKRGHSVKPDCFLDMVERVCDGPYLELFARRARFGWDYYGDQSLGTAAMPGAAA
jgi:N6-adenosine-specific RNA methylase IME4